jgi:hypothetical protein
MLNFFGGGLNIPITAFKPALNPLLSSSLATFIDFLDCLIIDCRPCLPLGDVISVSFTSLGNVISVSLDSLGDEIWVSVGVLPKETVPKNSSLSLIILA